MNSCDPELTAAQLGATALYQRAFMRCTVVACHVVERPDGVCIQFTYKVFTRAYPYTSFLRQVLYN